MPISASFPFFPSDYQGDPHTIVMTTEENGAYCLLMWVCWELEGLPNDIDELAGYARLPVKKFQPMWEKRIKRCFVFDTKRNQFLHPRFEKIIREIKGFRKQKSKAGKVSGRKRRERKQLNAEQVLDSVPVLFEQNANKNEPSFSSSSSSSTTKEEEEKKEETPQAATPKRGTRLSEPFYLTSEMREWAQGKRPTVDLEEETEKFCNYWRAKSGRDAAKLDWLATWKNWILNAKGNGNGTITKFAKRTDAEVKRDSEAFIKRKFGIA